MEPRSFNRGDLNLVVTPDDMRRASMEPRSFNRGDCAHLTVQQVLNWLQWSHGRLTVVTPRSLYRSMAD